MEQIVKEIVSKYWKEFRKKPNVKGYSMELRPRTKNGKIVPNTSTFVVYVEKKEQISNLSLSDLVPRTLALSSGLVETDVRELGEVKALVDKTAKIRPVPLGVSVGNITITAGSLGMLYNKNGEVYAGSNAHVLTPDPSLSPDKVNTKQILQPGTYHGGTLNDQVGEYFWHKQIFPEGASPCPIGNFVSKLLNAVAYALGRKGRFTYASTEENNIDFSVYKPSVEHILDVADGSLGYEPFIGHLFAGGNTTGVICKVKHIVAEGYIPRLPPAEVVIGNKVKGCSFWCNYETIVIDDAAAITVSYGSFSAFFTDVILVSNNGTIKGGWSGSGWRLIR